MWVIKRKTKGVTKMDSEDFGTMVFAGILGVVALGIGLGFILSIIL